MKKLPLVSIIVVTYDSQSYIKNCLDSVFQNLYPKYEVVVVDNNSSDHTINIVKKYQNKVDLVKNEKNLGFATGVNQGVKRAKGHWVMILNPDTQVTPNFLKPLIKQILSNQKIVVCQPAVFLLSDKKSLNLTGKETHYLGFDWIRDFKRSQARKSGEIYSFSGSAFLMSRSLFLKVGGFDEEFFMYYEDSDLAWRLRLLGYKFWFVAESKVYHDYQFIPKENYLPSSKKFFYAERNRLLTIYKNYSKKTLILLTPAICFFEVGMLGFALLNGWFFAKLKSYLSIWSLKKHTNKQRKIVQSLRKISDKQLVAIFTNAITFEYFQNPVIKIIVNPILILYWKLVKNFIR